MVQQGLIQDRQTAIGLPCSTSKKNICFTERCGIRELQEGKTESYFDWGEMSCKQDTSFLVSRKGEKVGYVEVVQDLTGVIRRNQYRKRRSTGWPAIWHAWQKET